MRQIWSTSGSWMCSEVPMITFISRPSAKVTIHLSERPVARGAETAETLPSDSESAEISALTSSLSFRICCSLASKASFLAVRAMVQSLSPNFTLCDVLFTSVHVLLTILSQFHKHKNNVRIASAWLSAGYNGQIKLAWQPDCSVFLTRILYILLVCFWQPSKICDASPLIWNVSRSSIMQQKKMKVLSLACAQTLPSPTESFLQRCQSL